MALSNRERVDRGFAALVDGLWPLAERLGPLPAVDRDPDLLVAALPAVVDAGAGDTLAADRHVIEELRTWRAKLADLGPVGTDDAYRMLDTIERALASVGASQAIEVGRSKDDLMRLRYSDQARRTATTLQRVDEREAGAVAGARPWREVVQPHDDVVAGRFSLAEFAADLYQVHAGEGRAEYVDPVEFFRRTYLTTGLRTLLTQAVERVIGRGGVPVVDLQTNFGGGKTHSMIALYHLFSDTPLGRLTQELQELVASCGATELPHVHRAVLVGNQLKPGQPEHRDGHEIRTMWGELAWQLGGADGFGLVAESDRNATNPGDALRSLLRRYAPCLILIDEWVAYARQLYRASELPAGTFDTHFSFAQALTEAARAVDGVVLVVSIPASGDGSAQGSDIEVGGADGHAALRRLRSVVGRVESSWRPAQMEESFEIVRRRLFQPLEPARVVDRDATARIFGELYRKQAAEFPVECREPAYEHRIRAAYPIHPELFARLYDDWSTLERFQRTRGVLRLMASVVQALWMRDDQSPLILPGGLPLDETTVMAELDRNLDDNWRPIVDADVDGEHSTARSLDEQFKNLGQYAAARRIARTVFLGSAPQSGTAHRGVEVPRIRLGCVLPGQPVAVYGDALNRLSDRATYLYAEGARYWYGTQPGVARVARDRAERLLTTDTEPVRAAILDRLRDERRRPGPFAGLHVAPSPAEVPDTDTLRMVVLGPERAHVHRDPRSEALVEAMRLLEETAASKRINRNMVVFLAGDHRRVDDLNRATAEWLAWRSIVDEAQALDLTPAQLNQAQTKRNDAERLASARLGETYQWLLVPEQAAIDAPMTMHVVRVDGVGDGLAAAVAAKLQSEGRLWLKYPASLLRGTLDEHLSAAWATGSVSVATLWESFARLPLLPRLQSQEVLMQAVSEGANSTVWVDEGFAVADAHDDRRSRFVGLTTRGMAPSITPSSLVVRPDVALRQQPDAAPGPTPSEPAPPARSVHRRFHGSVEIDATRLTAGLDRVAREILVHLTAVLGADVRVRLDVEAEHPDGFDDDVTRVVLENARALGFEHPGFDER